VVRSWTPDLDLKPGERER
jgi:hypothetical protein